MQYVPEKSSFPSMLWKIRDSIETRTNVGGKSRRFKRGRQIDEDESREDSCDHEGGKELLVIEEFGE